MGPRSGLGNVLTGSITLRAGDYAFAVFFQNCFILPAGTPPPESRGMLASSNMRDLLTDLGNTTTTS